MASATRSSVVSLEATVSSKGQVTLPSVLRKRLGLHRGSRIRFSLPARGPVEVEPVRFELEDLWSIADAEPKPRQAMSFEDMNAAKTRRPW